jgi:CubicO group peptidase (beta-lactamase class C family)
MRALAIVALIILGSNAVADDASLRDTVETATANYRAKRPFAALSVGIIQNGQRHTFGFGHTGEGDSKRPCDSRTLFEIGSITKVFTSLSLAVMADRGEVKLDDPISKLLPDWKLSENAGQITLHELSAHTSGLPRLPVAMTFDALWHSDNPYVNFDEKRLEHFLTSWEVPAQKNFMYSNLGAGLLGTALRHKAGLDSYEAHLQTTITTPLKMADTTITLSDDQKARYAHGMSLKGKPLASWDFVSLAGAGAIRSTADDLLTFLQQQITPESSPLAGAIKLTQSTRKTTKNGEIGLAWLVVGKDGRTGYFHNGATGGYTSFMAFEPAAKNGVVLLSNTADAFSRDNSLDKLGFDLLIKHLGARDEAKPAENK